MHGPYSLMQLMEPILKVCSVLVKFSKNNLLSFTSVNYFEITDDGHGSCNLNKILHSVVCEISFFCSVRPFSSFENFY